MNFKDIGRGDMTGLMWFRTGTGSGLCERGNEPSVSIQCWEILE
jgi:hypothetical protein